MSFFMWLATCLGLCAETVPEPQPVCHEALSTWHLIDLLDDGQMDRQDGNQILCEILRRLADEHYP